MAPNRAPTIVHVTLAHGACIGPTSEVVSALYRGGFIASKPYRVMFDADLRFLRVECEADKERHYLVPIANVSSITAE